MSQAVDRRRYRLLVFDWDGTLIDSIATIVDCAYATMRQLGVAAVPEDRIRSAIGLGLRETVDRMIPGCDDLLFARVVEVYRRLWFDDFGRRAKLFPEVEETLEVLRASGYVMAVATAKSRRGLAQDFERTGLADRFQASRTADEARAKPHPQMLFDLCGHLSIRPEETLVIGDTSHDLQMAHNAGANALAVSSGSQSAADLASFAPLAVLPSVVEVPAWLEEGPR